MVPSLIVSTLKVIMGRKKFGQKNTAPQGVGPSPKSCSKHITGLQPYI